MVRPKKHFFGNVFDSGIIEVWFKCIAYALVTSAFGYLYLFKEMKPASFVFVISYVFTAIQVVHGTREPYDKLKLIYVINQSHGFSSFFFEAVFLYIRLQIIISPLLVMFWAIKNGKLPL